MTLHPKGTQLGELEQLIETLRQKGLDELPAPHSLNAPYIPYYYTEAYLQERGNDRVLRHRQEVYRQAVLDNDAPHILEYFKERVELEEAIPKICARVREQLSKGYTREVTPDDWEKWCTDACHQYNKHSGDIDHAAKPVIFVEDPRQLYFPKNMTGVHGVYFLLDKRWDVNVYLHRFIDRENSNVLFGWRQGTTPVRLTAQHA